MNKLERKKYFFKELSPSSLSSSSSLAQWADDACLAVLLHALSAITSTAPARSHMIHVINAMYNCTGKTTIIIASHC